MIGYRKKSFFRAHELLTQLRSNLDDLRVLRELQIHLLGEITRTERQIRKLKAEMKLPQTNDARIRFLRNRIEGHRFSAYIWRSFGDAVAFTYLDKYALKQTYYQTGRKRPKADAGFISDKEGFKNELALLFSALDHNVPAILTDITNTIRHGDLCLMGASDPFLMEVKVSPSRNERARKQRESLEILKEFYETDASDRLWGNPDLRREALRDPEISYVPQLASCIETALSTGVGTANPEKGLYYYVVTSKANVPASVATFAEARAPWIFIWNDPLSRRSWMPYLPFTSTIIDPRQLWEFVRGKILIAIVIDMIALEEIVADLGFEGRFDPEEVSHPLLIKFDPHGGSMWISEDMLGRGGMECVSPRWLVKNSVESFRRSTEEIPTILEGDLEAVGFVKMNEQSRQELVRMGLPEEMELVMRRSTRKR